MSDYQYHIEPFSSEAVKQIIADGYEKGLFEHEPNSYSQEQLLTIYNHLLNYPMVVYKYNYYYQQTVKLLN